MPLLTLSSNVSLNYEINFQDPLTKERKETDSPADCPVSKPWLLVLHPIWLDLTWDRPITTDQDYLERFNIIAFDQRAHGRTQSVISVCNDLNTLAADMAFAIQKLTLPPVNVLASNSWASDIAIRLAAVFPEKVHSLFLCGLAPDKYTDSVNGAIRECFACLTTPETAEDWDEVRIGALHYFFFGGVPLDGGLMSVIDEWTGPMLRRYPPSKALDCGAVGLTEMSRKPDTKALKESVVAPVMILHGKDSSVFTAGEAVERFSGYSNVGEGSKLKLVDDAPLLLVPMHLDVIKEEFFEWIQPKLKRQAQSPQSLVPSQSNFQDNLLTLARIFDNPEIAQRDPFTSDSFHTVRSSEEPGLKALLDMLESRQSQSFSLYGGGAPESWTDASLEEKLPWR
ncbi:hypothetical protein CROQUDRAFT_53072 [Cronartium quercuum f. sp. fusiforme G11]|uniref:AB hydrolase-1 domain-containing protein n=1 Tax=Cronartium quercuum f. sp. fusiforme G11 TaxID=708437 RepID=A0A9P6NAQ2_9BASI|nr:hypothetical protein CROQUDRAFT_53072 [Cronartium quercuum f. sp. fusiforme G11]